MDEKRIQEYQKEVEGAINGLKDMLTRCQTGIGVLESFLYLIRKESQRQNPTENKDALEVK